MTDSLFSCYTCGFEESLFDSLDNKTSTSSTSSSNSSSNNNHNNSNNIDNMRASVSRQADHRHGFVSIGRVRSEERLLSAGADNDNNYNDQQQQRDGSSGNQTDENGHHHEGRELKTNSTMDEDDGYLIDDDNNSNKPPTPHATTPQQHRIHRRAMSDPFDTPISDNEMDEIRKMEELAIQEQEDVVEAAAALANTSNNNNNNKNNSTTLDDQSAPSQQIAGDTTARQRASSYSFAVPGGGSYYPTLPRYPVAATRDKNCWSEPPVSLFSVRGGNYLKDKKKVPSKDYLCKVRGCDLFLFDDYINVFERSTQILQGHLRSLPTLSINFQFPWGCMIVYYEIPEKVAKYVGTDSGAVSIDKNKELTVSEKVLAKWIQGDANYKNERLKLIPFVADGPWVVRNMVTGRPAIIGKKLPVSYSTMPADPSANLAPWLHCTLDIGSSSATAKRIVSVCRRYMSALTVDIGFVIQGDSANELPEQMMGASRIHGADPLKAPKL
ncbi:hypothetical protein ACA910_015227 [Epithemia clementina (nom. ined.)]